MTKHSEVKPHPLPPPYTDFTVPPHEERILPFLHKHGKTLIFVFALFFILFLITLLWQIRVNARSESEYIAAQRSFAALQLLPAGKEHVEENADYQRLAKILERYPELASRYDGRLAQTLIRIGNVSLAMNYADRALKELSVEHLPFYEEYAKTSLLMTEGREKEAYKRAVLLQKHMEDLIKQDPQNTPGFGPVLVFLNNVRLATLLEKMQMPQDALYMWMLINKEARATQDPLLQSLLQQWRIGDLSFAKYVETQKAVFK